MKPKVLWQTIQHGVKVSYVGDKRRQKIERERRREYGNIK